MKQKENHNRNKWLHVRLTEAEYQKIIEQFARTTEKYVSDYARKILLQKPMIRAVRNQSLQDIMADLSFLRKDLNGIANNYNQAVKKLNSYNHFESIRDWIVSQNKDAQRMLEAIETIKNYISKTAKKWLQD